VSDYIKRRKAPMIWAAALGLIVMPLMIYVPGVPEWLMFVLFFLLGVSASGNLVAYAYAHDLRPQGSAGTAEGFVNMWLIGGSALFQPVIGFIIEHTGRPDVNTLSDYRHALTVIVVTMFITLVCALALKETKCKSINY